VGKLAVQSVAGGKQENEETQTTDHSDTRYEIQDNLYEMKNISTLICHQKQMVFVNI